MQENNTEYVQVPQPESDQLQPTSLASGVDETLGAALVAKKSAPYFLLGILLVVLVFLVGGVAFWFSQKETVEVSNTDADVSVNTQITEEYKEETLDVYDLLVTVPATWTVTEINREEPNIDHSEPCADYLIQDDSGVLELQLDMTCGFFGGGPDIWPENAQIISEISDGTYLIRHQITDEVFQYGTGFENTGSEVGRTSYVMLSVGENGLSDSMGDIELFSASVSYTGSDADTEKLVSMADKVISSIKKQPRYSAWKEVQGDSVSLTIPEDWTSTLSENEYFGGEVAEVFNGDQTVKLTIYPAINNTFPYGFGNDATVGVEKNAIEITFMGEVHQLEETMMHYQDKSIAFVDYVDNGAYSFLFGTGYPAGSDDNASLNTYTKDRETIRKVLESFTVYETSQKTTDNTQTYQNSSLGFGIEYPDSVKIKNELNDQSNRLVVFQGDDVYFEVRFRKQPQDFLLEDYLYLDNSIAENSFFKNQPANIYKFPDGYCDGSECSDPFRSVVFTNTSDIVHISFYGDTELSNIESKILESFQFIEKEI